MSSLEFSNTYSFLLILWKKSGWFFFFFLIDYLLNMLPFQDGWLMSSMIIIDHSSYNIIIYNKNINNINIIVLYIIKHCQVWAYLEFTYRVNLDHLQFISEKKKHTITHQTTSLVSYTFHILNYFYFIRNRCK